MAKNEKISEYDKVSALTGTEQIEVVQDGANRRTDPQQIKEYIGGGNTSQQPTTTPSTESPNGVSVTDQEVHVDLTNNIVQLSEVVKNLASASMGTYIPPAPIPLGENIADIEILTASNNTDLIDVDIVNNYILLKKKDLRYQGQSSISIKTSGNPDKTLILRVYNAIGDVLLLERTYNIEGGNNEISNITPSPAYMDTLVDDTSLYVTLEPSDDELEILAYETSWTVAGGGGGGVTSLLALDDVFATTHLGKEGQVIMGNGVNGVDYNTYPLQLPELTTTEEGTKTFNNGMQWFNTTLGNFRAYIGGTVKSIGLWIKDTNNNLSHEGTISVGSETDSTPLGAVTIKDDNFRRIFNIQADNTSYDVVTSMLKDKTNDFGVKIKIYVESVLSNAYGWLFQVKKAGVSAVMDSLRLGSNGEIIVYQTPTADTANSPVIVRDASTGELKIKDESYAALTAGAAVSYNLLTGLNKTLSVAVDTTITFSNVKNGMNGNIDLNVTVISSIIFAGTGLTFKGKGTFTSLPIGTHVISYICVSDTEIRVNIGDYETL